MGESQRNSPYFFFPYFDQRKQWREFQRGSREKRGEKTRKEVGKREKTRKDEKRREKTRKEKETKNKWFQFYKFFIILTLYAKLLLKLHIYSIRSFEFILEANWPISTKNNLIL